METAPQATQDTSSKNEKWLATASKLLAPDLYKTYHAAATERKSSFWKKFDKLQETVDSALGGIYDPFPFALLGSVIVGVLVPPVGIAAFTALTVYLGMSGYSDYSTSREAKAEMKKDIASGVVTGDTYQALLEKRAQKWKQDKETAALIAERLSAPLPANGNLTAAFPTLAEAAAETAGQKPQAPRAQGPANAL